MLHFQTFACITHRNNLKNHTERINLKYQVQLGMKNLNYLMDHVLYLIFNIILSILVKIPNSDSPLRIYVNKIKNWITFKILRKNEIT